MFGQVVIGPPGSGKTTFCNAAQQFLTALGRKVVIINLDPANDNLPYKADVDLSELVTVEDVMENLNLGPNGALIYCMEYLEKNLDWLKQKLEKHKNSYFLFDCPGQVELYTHNCAVKNIVQQLTKWNYRVAAVHLVDSHYCSDVSKFVGVLLTSLSTMLQVELPHVNILSKADLIEKCGRLPFNLDFYTDVLDLNYVLEYLQDDPFFGKFKKLNKALIGIIEDYSLVSFSLLDVQDKECMLRVMGEVDRANGYIFGEGEERTLRELMSTAVGAEFQYEKIANIREKHMDLSDETHESSIQMEDSVDS